MIRIVQKPGLWFMRTWDTAFCSWSPYAARVPYEFWHVGNSWYVSTGKGDVRLK